jgi:Holliday junction resolvase RusA-like endonuclease
MKPATQALGHAIHGRDGERLSEYPAAHVEALPEMTEAPACQGERLLRTRVSEPLLRAAKQGRTAGWELKMQRPEPIPGWVRVTISLGLTKRRSDADNRIKVLLDSLVEHRLIEDDSKVAAVSVAWSGDVPPGRVRIEVRRARAPQRRQPSPQ